MRFYYSLAFDIVIIKKRWLEIALFGWCQFDTGFKKICTMYIADICVGRMMIKMLEKILENLFIFIVIFSCYSYTPVLILSLASPWFSIYRLGPLISNGQVEGHIQNFFALLSPVDYFTFFSSLCLPCFGLHVWAKTFIELHRASKIWGCSPSKCCFSCVVIAWLALGCGFTKGLSFS